jgi:sigma-E factor negative regulatory protein RseB
VSAAPIAPALRAVRAARNILVILGAGALGAAMCSATLRAGGAGDDIGLPPVPVGQRSSSPRVLTPVEQRALDLLMRAADAPRWTSYSGTKVLYVAGGHAMLIDVWHQQGGVTQARSRDVGDNGPAVSGPAVTSLDPHAITALTGYYALVVEGPTSRLGRAATAVAVTARDNSRMAARFVIDDATGLLLARSLFDARGGLVQESGYLDLRIGQAMQPPPVAVPEEADPPAVLSTDDLTDLRSRGWYLPDRLDGDLDLVEADQVGTASEPVVQLVFSDGVFTASLFVQRGRLDEKALDGFSAQQVDGSVVNMRTGVQRQAVWATDDHVFTLVGDLPTDRFAAALHGLPRRTHDDGVLDRLARGIGRVGSWLDPTG